jgi:EmrB/QacA subfamily drug resistance transporter
MTGGARRWPATTAVCAGVFLAAIDFYIVSVAVPDMLHSFTGSGIAEISWVFNGYTIAFTAALLPAAGLADRFGRRRVFLTAIAAFTVSALASAAAPSAAALIVARLVQGMAGGTITPVALALILPRFPAERRGHAIGLWSATQSAAVAAGPSLGGILVSAIGWRAVFGLQVPIGLIALAGTALLLDRDRAPAGDSRPPDLAGVLLLVPAIGLLALAIVQSHAWGILGWRTGAAFGAGLALGAAFVMHTLGHPAPVIDFALLKIRAVRRANLVMLLTGLVMYALPAATVLFLTGVWNYSEARAGLAVTPAPLMQAAAAVAGGRLGARYGPRVTAVPGAAALAASTLALAAGIGAHPRYWAVLFPAMLGSGVAIGLLVISLSTAALSEIPADRLASGTSISAVARAGGAVVSLSALALTLSAVPGGTTTAAGYHLAWSGMAVLSAAVLAASLALWRGTRQPDPALVQRG